MTTKFIILIGFAVAFTAGLMTGLRSQPAPTVAPTSSGPADPERPAPSTMRGGPFGPRGRSFLTRELELSPEQQERMKQIWSSMATRGPREQDELRRQFRNERDEAIAALVRAEDLGEYDKIIKAYSDKIAALDQEFRESYATAVEQTKQMLEPKQREKYEELLKRNQPWERGGSGGGDRDRGGDRRERD